MRPTYQPGYPREEALRIAANLNDLPETKREGWGPFVLKQGEINRARWRVVS